MCSRMPWRVGFLLVDVSMKVEACSASRRGMGLILSQETWWNDGADTSLALTNSDLLAVSAEGMPKYWCRNTDARGPFPGLCVNHNDDLEDPDCPCRPRQLNDRPENGQNVVESYNPPIGFGWGRVRRLRLRDSLLATSDSGFHFY